MPLSALSPRESEVLEHMARGLSNREIANALEITPATVKRHVEVILRKLDVENRTQASAVFWSRRSPRP